MDASFSRQQQFSIRVFLFAEYQMVFESLKHLIDSNRDMKVSSGARHLDDRDISTYGAESDVAVVYLSDAVQIEIVSQLVQNNPRIRVVVLAEDGDLESQSNALTLGAVGIVQKNQNPKFLIEAIRQTYKGETWLNQVLLHRILENGKSSGKKPTNARPTDEVDSLTARELQVIQMIGEGLCNKDLAKRLKIREATVRHHLSSIYGKIGVEDRVNLVIFAHKKGLISYSNGTLKSHSGHDIALQ